MKVAGAFTTSVFTHSSNGNLIKWHTHRRQVIDQFLASVQRSELQKRRIRYGADTQPSYVVYLLRRGCYQDCVSSTSQHVSDQWRARTRFIPGLHLARFNDPSSTTIVCFDTNERVCVSNVMIFASFCILSRKI